MKILKYLMLTVFLLSCAQVTSLNLKKHQFGKIPTKIIWFQVPGFDSEHIALLKYSHLEKNRSTAFEKSLCVGKAWDYSLYKIRPEPKEVMLTQLTGKKNIKGDCSDYKHRPIWAYVAKKNYKSGVFEFGDKKNTLLEAKKCKEAKEYLDDTIFWSMSKAPKDSSMFHVDEKQAYKSSEVYFDKSCSKGNCFTSFSRNVKGTFEAFSKNTNNYVFVIRDTKYLSYLKKNKIKKAKYQLSELNSSLEYFQNLASKSSDMLVIFTSSSSVNLDFPLGGKEWKVFEQKGRNLKAVNRKLMSSIFASGARAENFCGLYEQDQILTRIFSGAKQQGLEFSIINPFE